MERQKAVYSFIIASLFLTAIIWATGPSSAQDAKPQPAAQDSGQQTTGEAQPANPGRDLVLAKCGQCHTDSMWRDQRQDARAWEATLYRMVGRGALWSGDEIKTMAAFLGTDFGPSVPRKANAH